MCRDGPDRLAAFSGVRKLAEPLRYALATHRSANCVLVHLQKGAVFSGRAPCFLSFRSLFLPRHI